MRALVAACLADPGLGRYRTTVSKCVPLVSTVHAPTLVIQRARTPFSCPCLLTTKRKNSRTTGLPGPFRPAHLVARRCAGRVGSAQQLLGTDTAIVALLTGLADPALLGREPEEPDAPADPARRLQLISGAK